MVTSHSKAGAIALASAAPALSHLGVLGRALSMARRPGVLLTMRLPRFALSWIGRKRLRPLGGRVIDAQLAALLRFDDLLGESDLRGLSPDAARRRVEGSVMAVGAGRRRDVRSRELSLDGPVCALPCLLYEPAGAAESLAARRLLPRGRMGHRQSRLPRWALPRACRRRAGACRVRVVSTGSRSSVSGRRRGCGGCVSRGRPPRA